MRIQARINSMLNGGSSSEGYESIEAKEVIQKFTQREAEVSKHVGELFATILLDMEIFSPLDDLKSCVLKAAKKLNQVAFCDGLLVEYLEEDMFLLPDFAKFEAFDIALRDSELSALQPLLLVRSAIGDEYKTQCTL